MHISPDDKRLQYCGRIDFDDPKAPVLVYAASFVQIRFTGTEISVTLANKRAYWSSRMGYILDGKQGQFLLTSDSDAKTYVIAEGLEPTEHTLTLFKRMDSCHIVTLLGFELGSDAEVLTPAPLPSRKIEVFGDSVSCGEVSEAVDYVGKPDPEHDGEYSNSWYSYAWMTARNLHAQLHDSSQGGIALLDKTGWFMEPDYLGIESCYDKIEYQPELSEVKPWDFSRYTPDVVIFAFGQNDNHPDDYMAEDYNSARKVGLIAITLDENEQLIGVELTDGNSEIILATRNGIAIRFDEQDVRPMGRTAHGVRGIQLNYGDEVVAMDSVTSENSEVLTATEQGLGKRTSVSEYRKQTRGGKGVINIKVNEKTGIVIGMKVITPGQEIMMITAAGIIIRIDVEGISQFGRNAQGVKLMTLNDDDKVVSLAAVQQAEDDVTEEVITDDVQTETVDVSDEIIETSQATEE